MASSKRGAPAPVNEDEIVTKRLKHREAVVGGTEPSLTRLAKAFVDFTGAVKDTDAPAGQCDKAYNGLIKELALYEFATGKATVILNRSEAELKKYDEIQEEIVQQTGAVQAEIASLKTTLVEERTQRKQREEYESLSACVNKLPSRQETLEAIERCEVERRDLQTKKEDADGRMDVHAKQFHLMMRTIYDVKAQLQEEDEEGKRGAAGKKGGGDDVDMKEAS